MLKARAAATGRSAVSSLPPLLKRSNGRVPRTLPSAQQQQHLRHQRHQHGLLRSTTVAHASNKDDEALDRIKQAADGGDIWSSEIIAIVLKVGLVALFVTVTIVLLDAAQPIVQTTIDRFPKP
ncbi:hypothetical protein MNEG_4181 [Monoraphidium neglectum]|uniref:Uncharacterized protein n=1 Tax=Monoraphidium neglectum TaxID=145388 RepID=A0A0D2JZ40_9CHLO|nr:hypothetical protein MNEG_4181 [Monoraphidium neglectum]KIZ03778.1 hypothetical protein MNEG_4181 [Monoraphidium neglectum]|eukprot:XP_013902797.1 hypothetical protein MNEG_4181 [Monoraphidium neglectum]